jgi:hypothetical protein
MYDLQTSGLSSYGSSRYVSRHESAGVRFVRQATRTYERVLWRAQLGRLWGWLTGRPSALLDLESEKPRCAVGAAHPGGVQTVAIERIVGSEGRSRDFDRRFLPLRKYTRERWISVAVARQTDVPLPPVSLIQVGDRYYVRDGHHRISVARQMGQEYIEADIIVWELAEEPEPVHAPAPLLTPLPVL